MREIIPIKKDILFKTTIGQITNIDLEHNYNINNDLIEGTININGSYKMTEASVLEDDFNYNIPFKVSISKKVNKESIKIEIDDFKYEINKDVLNVEVDLLFTCDEINEEYKLENPINEEVKEEVEVKKEEVEELTKEDININENITNITNIVNTDNKYYTYKIYNVKENDSIDSICLKYNISIDEFKEYNDINEVHEGDKIIIPSNHE